MRKRDTEHREPAADDPASADEPQGESVPATPTEAAAGPASDAVDYHDRWLRAEAELQNFRRRARRDVDESRQSAEDSLLRELVGVIDDLERAGAVVGEGEAHEAWVKGVALVIQRFHDLIGRYGVTVVDPLGQPFDPNFHEALLEVEPPPGAAPGEVTQVVHKGYRRGGRALRAARVVVARHHSGEVD